MNKNLIYTIVGLAILIVVGIWLYKKYQAMNSGNGITNQTGRMSNPNSTPVKDCTGLYITWQNALKQLQFAMATGLTAQQIQQQQVATKTAEQNYYNCINS